MVPLCSIHFACGGKAKGQWVLKLKVLLAILMSGLRRKMNTIAPEWKKIVFTGKKNIQKVVQATFRK